MAAPVASALPALDGDGEARLLERAVVRLAGHLAKQLDLALGHSRLDPGGLERTALELHVEALRIAPVHARAEHVAVIRRQRKGSRQTLEIAGRMLLEPAAKAPAPGMDRLFADVDCRRPAQAALDRAEELDVDLRSRLVGL